jgi:hypothetical protein
MLKLGGYQIAANLDITVPALTAFTPSAISLNGATSWAMTLTRRANVPTYGCYVVTYNSASGFTCNSGVCNNDLMP